MTILRIRFERKMVLKKNEEAVLLFFHNIFYNIIIIYISRRVTIIISYVTINYFFTFYTDINECETSSQYPCDQICENTAGSYKCKCKPGFMLDYDGKSCTGKITMWFYWINKTIEFYLSYKSFLRINKGVLKELL